MLADLAGFAFVTRGKDDTILDHPLVQARLHLPADQSQQCPESQIVRRLYDCPAVPIGSEAVPCRVVVATHPEGLKKSPVGITREGIVYELFFTELPRASHSAPAMSSNWICIAVPLNRRFAMRIRNSTRIAGALTAPVAER